MLSENNSLLGNNARDCIPWCARTRSVVVIKSSRGVTRRDTQFSRERALGGAYTWRIKVGNGLFLSFSLTAEFRSPFNFL